MFSFFSIVLTGKLPFHHVMMHGVVCDSQGKKMSKSKGNVVDPLHVINGRSLKELEEDLKLTGQALMNAKEMQKALKSLKATFPSGIPKCGTDALRFSLVHNDPKSQQLNVDVNFIYTCAAFCNKIWQATRFFLLAHERLQETETYHISEVEKMSNLAWLHSNHGKLRLEDKWILSKYATTVKEVNENLEKRDFHLAVRALRSFLYSDLCDVYVEASKPFLIDIHNKDFQVKYTVMKVCLMDSLKLLHPIMPFITEELYQRILSKTTLDTCNDIQESIMIANYPNFKDWELFESKSITNDMNCILEIVSNIRSSKKLFNLKRSINPSILIVCDDSTQNINFSDHEMMIETQKIISVLSPCGNVKMIQKREFDTNGTANYENVSNWWKTDVPSYECIVYLDPANFIDVTEELNKISSQRNKALDKFENMKRKKEKQNDTLSEGEIDLFNCDMRLLNERELFLRKIQEKIVK